MHWSGCLTDSASSHLISSLPSTCTLPGGRVQPWMCCSKAAPTTIGRFQGGRELSEPWTGFTLFTRLNEKTSRRRHVVLGAADKNSSNIKARPLARNLVRNVQSISTKRKHHWATEQPKVDNARKLRGLCFDRSG